MEAAEHVWIGDQVVLKFESGDAPAAGRKLLTAPDGPGISYGQGIALGGDFYGVVGTPISTAADPKAAFRAAWGTLLSAGAELPKVLAVMAEEIDAVKQAQAAGTEPSKVYAKLGDSLSMRWNGVTGGASKAWVPPGRYLNLLRENWDHFGSFAVTAYRAGHAVACEDAGQANHPDLSPEERAARLGQAYAMDAFANHFLTDLFSAGHMRTPRKELYDSTSKDLIFLYGTLGALLARCMHDEDNEFGLTVHNQGGNTWKAYGDKRLLDSVSGDNRGMVVAAVQASVNDVWHAYQGQPVRYMALDYAPDLLRVEATSPRENFSPLFIRHPAGGVARRVEITDRNDYHWTKDFPGWGTYAALELTESYAYQHVRCYDLASNEFVGWLSGGYNDQTIVVQDENNAHGMVWSFDGEDLYLQKDTDPYPRYLGVSWKNSAGWGSGGKAGWKNPVVYNPDGTISLHADPQRKLYRGSVNKSNDWFLYWSDGTDSRNLIRIDLPFPGPSVAS